MPDSFDLKGVLKLILSILGLTWTNIRTRIVAKIGEKAMAAFAAQGETVYRLGEVVARPAGAHQTIVV